mmetsp:Transcript_59463/g.169095  ORF Transcript_59463/g.169095 Transcript_59463/m.169095 type:complete len:333 (+) Transcript_59463:745-1743(+)
MHSPVAQALPAGIGAGGGRGLRAPPPGKGPLWLRLRPRRPAPAPPPGRPAAPAAPRPRSRSRRPRPGHAMQPGCPWQCLHPGAARRPQAHAARAPRAVPATPQRRGPATRPGPGPVRPAAPPPATPRAGPALSARGQWHRAMPGVHLQGAAPAAQRAMCRGLAARSSHAWPGRPQTRAVARRRRRGRSHLPPTAAAWRPRLHALSKAPPGLRGLHSQRPLACCATRQPGRPRQHPMPKPPEQQLELPWQPLLPLEEPRLLLGHPWPRTSLCFAHSEAPDAVARQHSPHFPAVLPPHRLPWLPQPLPCAASCQGLPPLPRRSYQLPPRLSALL